MSFINVSLLNVVNALAKHLDQEQLLYLLRQNVPLCPGPYMPIVRSDLIDTFETRDSTEANIF